MAANLVGKVVCVTGGGRGMGRAIAELAGREGAFVIVADYGGSVDGNADLSNETAEEVAAGIRAAGGKAFALSIDVSTMAGGRALVDAAVDHFGRIDGIVCCAGILIEAPFLELQEADLDRSIGVHIKGCFTCAQSAARRMIEQGGEGRLIFFGSGFGLEGSTERPAYRVAKAGVAALSLITAEALAPYNITTNCIMPRAATRMTDFVFLNADPAHEGPLPSEQGKETPLNPENVAPFVCYLLSDAAAGINGQFFGVAGHAVGRITLPQRDAVVLERDSKWTVDDLLAAVPGAFGEGLDQPMTLGSPGRIGPAAPKWR